MRTQRVTLKSVGSSKRVRRRGAAVTELAFVLPILAVMALGIIEIGRKLMVSQIVTNAARDGARRATILGGGNAACTTAVNNYLSAQGISGASTTITPSADASSSGTPITVTVSIPYSSVRWSAGAMFTPGKVLNGRVVMRKQ